MGVHYEEDRSDVRPVVHNSRINGWSGCSFREARQFIDIGRDDDQQQQVLRGLVAHLKAVGDKQVSSSQNLLIEVLNVNLAGEEHLIPSRAAMLRVLRRATPPSIQVRYILSEGGVALRSAVSRLSALGYQDGTNRYHRSDALRYEKAMVYTWFRTEFSGVLASA